MKADVLKKGLGTVRPASRLLSVLLTLILLATSLLTVSAHDGTDHDEDDPTYDVTLTISLTDEKETVNVGTELSFFVTVERHGEHGVPYTAILSSVTAGGYPATNLGSGPSDNLVGSDRILSKLVKYTVKDGDLGGGSRRIAPIRFRLSFTPIDSDGNQYGTGDHPATVIVSNREPVLVTEKGTSTVSPEDPEIDLFVGMDAPKSIRTGGKVVFSVTVGTGEYELRTAFLRIRKQLYDADGDEIGGSTPVSSIPLRLKSRSTGREILKTYVFTSKDATAATAEFTYELTVEDIHLKDEDGDDAGFEADFEKVFENEEHEFIVGKPLASSATPTPTARLTPTPQPATLVGRTSAATVTRVGDSVIRFDLRHGQDFNMTIGFIADDGTRGFHRFGYIRDEGLGQTYAVVNRESDNRVVRVWIAPDSAERYQVPWQSVLDFWTFPQSVVNAIPLDEMHPAENQLVDSGGDFYVYTSNAWRHIPDIATFQARGFFWCDITSADAQWLSRVRIGRPLPSSGTLEIPNYPNCRE